jgi:hypothetical protein
MLNIQPGYVEFNITGSAGGGEETTSRKADTAPG